MTPLFITAIGRFIRQTKGWWIGLAIVLAVIAVILFIIGVIWSGAGLFLIVPAIFLIMAMSDW